MTATLGLVHTSATLVPVFAELCARHLPGVETFNIVDDSLIKNTIAAGRLTPGTARRVAGHIGSAEAAGAPTSSSPAPPSARPWRRPSR